MAVQTTPNLGLTLPYQSDAVAVSTQNDNMTIIDTFAGGISPFKTIANRKIIESSQTGSVTVPSASNAYQVFIVRPDRRKSGLYLIDSSGATAIVAGGASISMTGTTISIINENAYTVYATVYCVG